MEEVVSDVLFNYMSDKPYANLKMGILHQTNLVKLPTRRTKQTDMEHYCEEPLSLNQAKVMNTEMMHAEDLEDIPQQLTTSINSAVHLIDLNMP